MFTRLQLYESWQLCLHVYNYVKADNYVYTFTIMWKLTIMFTRLQLCESWHLCLHVYNHVKADNYV